MPARKKKKKNPSLLPKRLRYLGTAIFFLVFLLWSGWESLPEPLPSGNTPPLLYSNHSNDDLRALYLQAIGEAQKSIDLWIYSLSDAKIIRALKEKAESGVRVTVTHDMSTPQFGFDKLGTSIHQVEPHYSGLMHRKILVVDGEKIWIGSANFTTQSLRMDGNLVVGIASPALGKALINQSAVRDFLIADQRVEYWSLPEDKEEALKRLVSLIDSAKKTVRVAMFTLTHPTLVDAMVRAQERQVFVEVAIDGGQAHGVCEKSVSTLLQNKVPLWIFETGNLLHYKCACIDDRILITGSANWTKAAFTKNGDCFLIIHDLRPEQIQKVRQIWKSIHALSSENETIPLAA